MKQNDPPLDKFLCLIYIGKDRPQSSVHDTWIEAVTEAEKNFLNMPRRWCHGIKDKGHWALVEVMADTEWPEGMSPSEAPPGVLRPGPLALVFIPYPTPCCDYHGSIMRVSRSKRGSGEQPQK